MSIIATIGAASLGTKIALAAAGATVVVCSVACARPSTLLRVGEDASLAAARGIKRRAKSVAKSTKRFGRNVAIEYRARQIDRLQQAIATEAATLRNMPPEERAELAAAEAAVFARAEQLRAKREGRIGVAQSAEPRRAKRRKASPSSSTATA